MAYDQNKGSGGGGSNSQGGGGSSGGGSGGYGGSGGTGQYNRLYKTDPNFLSLQSNYSALLGFTGFSYEEYLTDQASREYVHKRARERGPEAQAALDRILAYFQGTPHEQAGGKIDVNALYDPLRGRVEEGAAAQLMAGRGAIAGGTQRALAQAREAQALTGQGRSGVGAAQFAGISREGASAAERLLERVNAQKAQDLFRIDQQVAEAQFGEELRQRGADQDFINGLIAFRREAQMMEFEHNLNYEEEGFLDFLPDILGAGAQVGAAYLLSGCHCAAVYFGYLTPKWFAARRTILASPIASLYVKHAWGWSRALRKHRWLRAALKPVFVWAARRG